MPEETAAATIDLGDIKELFDKLVAGGAVQPAIDPLTAMFNFGTAALNLTGKIIDTVPDEQHAKNWADSQKRWEDFLNKIVDAMPPPPAQS